MLVKQTIDTLNRKCKSDRAASEENQQNLNSVQFEKDLS